MKYMLRLFESRPIIHRIPAPEMIKGCQGDWSELTKIAAGRSDDGAYAFIYFPNDTITAEIRVCEISGKKLMHGGIIPGMVKLMIQKEFKQKNHSNNSPVTFISHMYLIHLVMKVLEKTGY